VTVIVLQTEDVAAADQVVSQAIATGRFLPPVVITDGVVTHGTSDTGDGGK
jgi:hypothetical protein